jgi:RNA polymerase sigma-70 factor (ECF subfamily)
MLERVVAWDETPEELVEREETAGILDAAVDALPATLRSTFVLRDLEERSTAEAAQILGVSEQVVKVRLHRARLALRERLGAEFGTGAAQARTMTCEQVAQYLSDYIDKEIDAPLKKQAEEHIATCNHCHVLLDTTQKTLSLYHTSQPRVIPITERERLYRAIQAAFQKRKRS